MPSPDKGESKKDYISRCMSSEEAKRDFPDSNQRVAFCNSKWGNRGKSSATIYIYEDPRTGEVYQYSRRGVYKKNGRTLIFLRQSKGDIVSTDHILNRISKTLADEKAGYPPNCNDGYVEKDGDCIPKENDEG